MEIIIICDGKVRIEKQDNTKITVCVCCPSYRRKKKQEYEPRRQEGPGPGHY